MNEEKSGLMVFEALGVNCCDCGFSLTGHIFQGGAEICSKIEQELRKGTLGIDVQAEEIHFVFEGVKITFTERPERLLAMLQPERHLNFKPSGDSNYKGFILMAGD